MIFVRYKIFNLIIEKLCNFDTLQTFKNLFKRKLLLTFTQIWNLHLKAARKN